MSNDDDEAHKNCVSKEDAEEMVASAEGVAEEAAVNRAAEAINEFLYQISLGYTPTIAFERAVDGETATALCMPSNMSCITVVP